MLYLAISGGVLLGSCVITIITTIKAKRTKKTVSNDANSKPFLERFKETLKKVTTYSLNAEKVFENLQHGKFGSTKLEEVLNKIKVDCLSNGENFDEESWKTIVNNLISFSKNVNKSN